MRFFAPLVVFALAACQGAAPEKKAEACDYLPRAEAPAWVTDDFSEPGYFSARGNAGRSESFEAQTQQAQRAALKALTQSISVSVQTTQSSDQRVSRAGGQETIVREARDLMQATSNLTLQKVEPAGQWLDRKSCILWMRLRVHEATVRYERLRVLSAILRDHALPLHERREALDVAEALLPQVDFSRVVDGEGAEFFRALLEKERASMAQIKTDSLAILLVAPTLSPSIARDFVQHLPDGRRFMVLERPACDTIETCTQLARRHGAETLLFGRANGTQVTSTLGGINGKLTIESSLSDVATGKVLWGPKQVVESMATFGRFAETDWRDAARKAAGAAVFQSLTLCLTILTDERTCS